MHTFLTVAIWFACGGLGHWYFHRMTFRRFPETELDVPYYMMAVLSYMIGPFACICYPIGDWLYDSL